MEIYNYREKDIENIQQHKKYVYFKKLLNYITNLQKENNQHISDIQVLMNKKENLERLTKKLQKENEKLKEKSSLILDYLKKTFKVDNVVNDEEFDINSTIYNLRFGYMGIGIRISNEMIINADIEYLYRYSYDLVFNELIKITKQKYVNLESFEN